MPKIQQALLSILRGSLKSLGDLWRRPWACLMTSLVIALALCLPVALLMGLNLVSAIAPSFTNSLSATVYFHPGIESHAIDRVLATVTTASEIAEVKVVTPKKSLTDLFGTQISEQDLQQMGAGLIPTVLEVRFKAEATDQQITQLQQSWQQLPEIESVSTDLSWFQRLHLLQQWGWRAFWVFMLGVGASVFLVLAHVIRASLSERRHEIEIQKLFGATPSFIRRPFLYQGCWLGFLGASLATLILGLVYLYIGPMAGDLATSFGLQLAPKWSMLECIGLMFALGISIGYISAAWSVQVDLHKKGQAAV